MVRRDRKLSMLTKETVETLYHFHFSLRLNSFEDKDSAHHLPNGLTPTDFREFMSVLQWIRGKYFNEQFERSNIPCRLAQTAGAVGPSWRLFTADKLHNCGRVSQSSTKLDA